MVPVRSVVFTNDPDEPLFPYTLNTPTSLAQLPTCPVCLERLDLSISGIMTTACRHTFHCQCLSKWGEGRCPVCRDTISSGFKDSDYPEHERNRCISCGTVNNLWICLICGNIGCGRYEQAHAWSHYVETQHLYVLELETQRVWDYAGDGYVHRLIQNKTDGKLVELPEFDNFKSLDSSEAEKYLTTVKLTSLMDSKK